VHPGRESGGLSDDPTLETHLERRQNLRIIGQTWLVTGKPRLNSLQKILVAALALAGLAME
jgi:hypothetical protein